MEIKTKYKIGDIVWLMSDNKIWSFRIHRMDISLERSKYIENRILIKSILYYPQIGAGHLESELCATKEELRRRVFNE